MGFFKVFALNESVFAVGVFADGFVLVRKIAVVRFNQRISGKRNHHDKFVAVEITVVHDDSVGFYARQKLVLRKSHIRFQNLQLARFGNTVSLLDFGFRADVRTRISGAGNQRRYRYRNE